MSDPATERMVEFASRITESDKKNDYDGVIEQCKSYATYLEALMDKEKNAIDYERYFMLNQVVKLVKRITENKKNQDATNDEYDDRVSTLEVRLDELERKFNEDEKLK